MVDMGRISFTEYSRFRFTVYRHESREGAVKREATEPCAPDARVGHTDHNDRLVMSAAMHERRCGAVHGAWRVRRSLSDDSSQFVHARFASDHKWDSPPGQPGAGQSGGGQDQTCSDGAWPEATLAGEADPCFRACVAAGPALAQRGAARRQRCGARGSARLATACELLIVTTVLGCVSPSMGSVSLGHAASSFQFSAAQHRREWDTVSMHDNDGMALGAWYHGSPGEVTPRPYFGAPLGSTADVCGSSTDGAQAIDEVPGTRPFSPEPEGFEEENELGEQTVSPGERLPPSSQWEGAKVPEWNSLAHMKLLKELDGLMPSHLEQIDLQTPPQLAATKTQTDKVFEVADAIPLMPTTLQANCPWQTTFGSPFSSPMDQMLPFGAPNEYAQRQSHDYSGPHLPPPMYLPPVHQASIDSEAGTYAEGQLVAQERSVVGYARVRVADDEELSREQLLLRWKQAEKNHASKIVQPSQRVDASVRDFVSRARFAAGQGAEVHVAATTPRHAGTMGDDATKSMSGQSDEGELACPGSPVSSMWSQDPCGYWVQDTWAAGAEPTPYFDLGYWPEVPTAAAHPHAAPHSVRREGSLGDLWSTVEGEDGEATLTDLQIETTCGQKGDVGKGYGVVDAVVGMREVGGSGGKCDLWCDQFVPRPLQLEFARELRWFAWQGREDKDGAPPASTDNLHPKTPPHKATPRRTKTQSRKHLQQQQRIPPFSLSLPLSTPLTAWPSLPPLSLQLRSPSPEEHTAHDGDQEMQVEEENDVNEDVEGEDDADIAASALSRGGLCKPGNVAKNGLRRSVSRLHMVRRSASLSRMATVSPSPAALLSASSSSRQHCASSSAITPSFGIFTHAEGGLETFECLAVCVAGGGGAGDLQEDGRSGVGDTRSGEHSSGWHGVLKSEKPNGLSRLDQVQVFKIREMLREMHRLLVSHTPQLLVANGENQGRSSNWGGGGCGGGGGSGWSGSGDRLMWRLIMYDAMMHAQSLVATAGHASIKDGIAILDRMTAAGVPPTLHTYNKYLDVVAGAASHGHGNGTHAQDAFVRMAQAGIEPNRETYWAWLSVLGSAVYHGQATMQQVYWALQNINKPTNTNSAPPTAATMMGSNAPDTPVRAHATDARGSGELVQEDIRCLQLCLRAAVGGAQRGLAGKADVEWVLRRLRSLQLEADDDTWVLAMQVLVQAAQRGEASVADAERLLDKAEAAGHMTSPALHCAFFQAAAAAASSHKQKYAPDARERVLARLQRLERLCANSPHPSHLQNSLLSLTQAVRAYFDGGHLSVQDVDKNKSFGSGVRGRGRGCGGGAGRGGKALMALLAQKAGGGGGGGGGGDLSSGRFRRRDGGAAVKRSQSSHAMPAQS